MIKSISTLVMIFGFILLGHSQITKIESEKPIKETKVSPMGVYYASMEFFDDYSILYFKDSNYPSLNVIVSCKLDNETRDSLYELMISKDAKEGDEYHVKTLGDETVFVVFTKVMGFMGPVLYLYEGEYDSKASKMYSMSRKQLGKLFGKR